jgi:hypothetical protein
MIMRLAFVPSTFTPLYDPSLEPRWAAELTFSKLEAFFQTCLRYTGPKEKHRMYLCARIKPWKECIKREDGGASRCTENIQTMTGLVIDLDNKEALPVIDPEWFIRDYLRCRALAASSASSTAEHPRSRVVIPITREVTTEEYKRLQHAILVHFAQTHPEYVVDRVTAIDPACAKPAQPHYLPQTPTTGAAPFIIATHGLPVFDVNSALKAIPKEKKPKHEPAQQVEANDELLDYATKCLNSFDPNDEDDRFMTASAMLKTFSDPAFAHRAEAGWQDWYRQATNWTEAKAAKKWHDAEKSPSIHIGFVLRKRPSKLRKANDENFKGRLIAKGFMSQQLKVA